MTRRSTATNPSPSIRQRLLAIPAFYVSGFRDMTVGRSLWLVIAIKMVVLFGVLKLLFFPDFLESHFDTDAERSNYVLEQITTQPVVATPDTGAETDDWQP